MGIIMPIRKKPSVRPDSLHLILAITKAAIALIRTSMISEHEATNTEFIKYQPIDPVTHASAKFCHSSLSGKPHGFANISLVVLSELINNHTKGYKYISEKSSNIACFTELSQFFFI